MDATADPTRRGKLFTVAAAVAVIAGAVVLVGLSLSRPTPRGYSPTAPAPAPAGDSLVGPVTYTVDASDAAGWSFFDFSRGSVVTDPGPLEWDVAFRRFEVMVNGGKGFAGRGGIVDLGPARFDSVHAAPAEGYVPTRSDSTHAVTEEWYDYSFLSHLLTSRGHTYAVRTADGRYAKLAVLGYYCPGAAPGCLTFRYAYQGAGGRSFER